MAREILWPDRLNTKRAAAYLDLAYDTLVQWRKKDVGPAYHKFGRLVVYMKNDLDQWISRCRINGAAFGNKRPPRLIPDQDAV